MTALLCAFGVCFVLRGVFMFTGRTVPKSVVLKLKDNKDKLKGWCQGTGTVHILWGVCAILIWCANTFVDYALYIMVAVIICVIGSILVSLWTTYKFSNK